MMGADVGDDTPVGKLVFERSGNQINSVRLVRAAPDLPANVVASDSKVTLWTLRTHRLARAYRNQPLQYMPVGWMGNWDAAGLKAGFMNIARGTVKQAIWLVEPYLPIPGTVFIEYRLTLPNSTPIKLTFANANEDGPKGDGVLFRVWVDDSVLFSRRVTNPQWVDGEVDLSAHAGKTVLLHLESHSGIAANVKDDRSYWGEPTVTAEKPSGGSRR